MTDAPVVAPDQDEAGLDRIFTLPNAITMVRLACLPVFLWLLFAQDDRHAAAWLLAALGVTDHIDGYIARRWHQVSTLGKVLDPVADRLLFFVGGGAIVIDGSIPLWVGVAVLVKEVAVSVATVGLALAGARRIDVTWWGKAGTFALMMAFPLFLVSHADIFWADAARVMAWLTVIPGLVLSYIALAMYVPLGLTALREGRADRAAGATADPQAGKVRSTTADG